MDVKAWVKRRAKADDRLYQRYGKPLERDHTGEYVAIGPNGEIILGDDDVEVGWEALQRFGAGNFAFRRIGYSWEAKWRSHRAS